MNKKVIKKYLRGGLNENDKYSTTQFERDMCRQRNAINNSFDIKVDLGDGIIIRARYLLIYYKYILTEMFIS